MTGTGAARERMTRPWTLRRRLVLGTVALLAVLGVVIGTVSVLTLQTSLTVKLDQELREALGRGPGPAGLGPGALLWQRIDGEPAAGSVLGDEVSRTGGGPPVLTPIALTARQLAEVGAITRDGRPTTVTLTGLGAYRIVAFESRVYGSVAIGLPMTEVTSTVTTVAAVVFIVVLVVLALAAIAGAAVIRSALRPLERVTATASHVSELPLERGGVALEARVPEADADDRTEVGRVGAAINRMLGHIAGALALRDASEGKLRTFVADASHELRTPLASIRGYAELTRRSGHVLPDDVVHALGRIESESVRMTSLVEDLLLLARLDDGRELEKQPVDLVPLLADAVSDAYAAGQDHDWALDAPGTPVLVTGDAPRLHQVVVNLLANARVHTPAGTHVVAAVTVDGDVARVSVTDDGPGIAPEVLPTVFERFVRGDGSRARVGGGPGSGARSGSGSTGLGLAIVSAVVAAHDGTVDVASEPGRTVFTVTLPLAATAPRA
ncbi:HAMP domain-containing sensor histidine kinase [Galbitalea sp. SE-J8]|uniref:sensor histidine kinase n=1 Tax=Galbitalea sp. SE-J8 TaxID=3054952 RepID=UPI00259CABCE|nr:HAMP domain-containing sensor histidine kinase [Galbitalea sp. SE-J8]MDM4762474.1 HAMP domain-containing sensor histidine kinase [Galbitalea sp. SE-J8]